MKQALMTLVMLLVVLGAIFEPVLAHDRDGRYAKLDPEMHKWFESLHSGKGPCCADADGNVVADADWESVNDPAKPSVHFRVRMDVSKIEGQVDMQWLDVEDDALVTVPNKFGRTMVWPIRGYLGTTIRCFMPGPMT